MSRHVVSAQLRQQQAEAARWNRRLTTDEAVGLTQKPETEVRAVPNRLVEFGLIEARGECKGRTRHLSAVTYGRLAKPATHVRQRGFEPLQQEQMVMQYVEKHGRITRSEAAVICQLGPYQAARVLDILVRAGKLVRLGTKRGMYYERRAEIMSAHKRFMSALINGSACAKTAGGCWMTPRANDTALKGYLHAAIAKNLKELGYDL